MEQTNIMDPKHFRPHGRVTSIPHPCVLDPNFISFVSRRQKDLPIEVWPNIYSNSEAYGKIAIGLYDLLSTKYKGDTITGGFYDNDGMPTDWSRLLSVPGFPMNPKGVAPTDAPAKHKLKMAASKGEAQRRYAETMTPDPDDLRILRDMASLIFSNLAEPKPVSLKRTSNMGAPAMSRSLAIKESVVDYWHTHADRLIGYVRDWELEKLADEGLIFLYVPSYRKQIDKVGKVRTVQDWLGKIVEANKSLPSTLPFADRRGRVRTRTVSMYSMSGMWPARPAAKMVEYGGLYTEYGMTFKNATPADVAGKVGKYKYATLVDVSNHDQSMPPQVIDILVEAIRAAFGDFQAEMARMCFKCPSAYINDYADESGFLFTGDFTNPDHFDADYINPSGVPWTSVLAKLIGAWYSVLAFIYGGHVTRDTVTRSWIDAFLKHQLDSVAALNAGDNLFLLSNVKDIGDPTYLVPYCELDPSGAFLGRVYIRNGANVTSLPNPESFIVNALFPEHGVGHSSRWYWAYGWRQRLGIYQEHPLTSSLLDDVNAVFKSSVGVTFDQLADEHFKAPPTSQEVISFYDELFVANPDVVYYLIDPDMISAGLRADIFSSITPDRFMSLIT